MAIGKLPEADVEGSEDSIFAEINITPLTDVFLVMLIIFMVASSVTAEADRQKVKAIEDEVATEKRSGIKINMPKGETQEIDPTKPSLVVSILKSGEVIIDEKKLTPEQLSTVFERAFARNNEIQLVLKADTGVPHGRVVEVMEAARKQGITRLAIGTAGGGG